jgi:hypothetical protein
MRRIEPDSLIPVFRKIKKKPIQGEFVNKKGDGCCAMSAMAIHVLRPKGATLDRFNIGRMAREYLGFSDLYFAGFVSGWDDRPGCEVSGDPESIQGYSDGKSNWLACVQEGLIKE